MRNRADSYLENLSQLELPIDIFIKLLAATMNHITSYDAWLSSFKKDGCYHAITSKIGTGSHLSELCENLIALSLLYQGNIHTVNIADIRKTIRLSYIDIISKNLAAKPTVGQLIAYLVLNKNSQKFCFTDCLVLADQAKGIKLFFAEMHNPKRYSNPLAAQIFMKQVVANIKHALDDLAINTLSPITALELMACLTSQQMNELLMMTRIKPQVPALPITKFSKFAPTVPAMENCSSFTGDTDQPHKKLW